MSREKPPTPAPPVGAGNCSEPRAASLTREDRRRLLAMLEVPDCDCPLVEKPCEHAEKGEPCPHEIDPKEHHPCPPRYERCPHVGQARDHSLPWRDWADLLAAAYPGEYDDGPPPPDDPTNCVSREDRAAVLAVRVASGRSPWHPDDLVRQPDAFDAVHAGPGASRLRNGAVAGGACRTEGLPDAPLSPREAAEFARLEMEIARAQLGLKLDKGEARYLTPAASAPLARIRDGRLYRDEYPSFPRYLKDRWGIDPRPRKKGQAA